MTNSVLKGKYLFVTSLLCQIVLNKKYCISRILYINSFYTIWENDIYCLCQQKNLLHQYLDDGSLISIIFLTYLNATRFRQTILRDKSLPFMVSRLHIYQDHQDEIWLKLPWRRCITSLYNPGNCQKIFLFLWDYFVAYLIF